MKPTEEQLDQISAALARAVQSVGLPPQTKCIFVMGVPVDPDANGIIAHELCTVRNVPHATVRRMLTDLLEQNPPGSAPDDE